MNIIKQLLPTPLFLLTLFFLLYCFNSIAQNNPLSLQLAKNYNKNVPLNINEYWVSEKLDGVRARWTGEKLLTRQGNTIITPKLFTQGWPKQAFDGELWMGRNSFDQLSGIVRRHSASEDNWQNINFMAFDLPDNKNNFSQRYQTMLTIKSQLTTQNFKVIKQWRIPSVNTLEKQLNEISQNKGEGLMLHHESATYQSGRSEYLLKVKQAHDSEAVVIKHMAGKGKYAGQMGAILVKTDTGIVFKIGSGFTDQQRMTPPPIGCTITFKYYGKTSKGVPRFASFVRIRE